MSKNVNRSPPYFLNAVRQCFTRRNSNLKMIRKKILKVFRLETHKNSYLYESEYSEEDLKQRRRRRRRQLLQPRGKPSLSQRMRSLNWIKLEQSGGDGAELSPRAVSLSRSFIASHHLTDRGVLDMCFRIMKVK